MKNFTRQSFVSCSDGIMLLVDLYDIDGYVTSCTTMVFYEEQYEVIL